jgi:hypothetical protein
MLRLLLTFICVTFVVCSLSGCFGMISYQPGECEKETPPWSTKAEYLKEWGKPKSVENISGDREIWVYEESVWCGVIPCLGICVPLMLPVCDGYERVYFKGDTARRVHTRRTLNAGIVLLFMAESERACITPLSPSVNQEIEPGRTVALSVTIDTPEHQQDKEYQEVARLLRELLAKDLVDKVDGVFKTVVTGLEPADYVLEVKLRSANIPGFFGSYYEACMTVNITERGAKQQIGNFEIQSVIEKHRTQTVDAIIQFSAHEIVRALHRVDDMYDYADIYKSGSAATSR